MKRMNVRTFRNSFSRVTEPIEVLRGTQTLGVFYPGFITQENEHLGMVTIQKPKPVPKEK